MSARLKNIFGLIALVLLFTACSKDAELFTVEDDLKIEKVAVTDEGIVETDADGVANTDSETETDTEEVDGINDDDDEEDDDEGINDDDDDEDDDESNTVKIEGIK